MKLVFGLGNPEESYRGTRHNAGFLVLDAFAEQEKSSFTSKDKFFADVAELRYEGEKVLLVKPTTYYNLVGQSFRALLDFYKLDPADVLIVHDELALPFGTLRARVGGSDAGNNGIKSINQYGGEATNRLRIGIANDQRTVIGDTDFVIARFSKDETQILEETVLPKALELLRMFIVNEHQPTSHTIFKY